MAPILEIDDLSVAYRSVGGDVHAVEHVNLTLNAGEVVGLCGESGSGKSTLAYGATRLLRPPALITGGSVRYRGRRITQGGDPADVLTMNHKELARIRWREVAIVFQSAMNALNPVLRVQDQILDAITAHLKLPKHEAREKAATLLDLVGIPRDRLRAYPHELSGGMRQRVMIAMALAADPEVVIMDEPTTALDVVVQRDILAQIVELKERLGFAILFITHDLSLLLELADRIEVMYAGRLMETGASRDLIRDPAHPYTRGLLNSFPSIRGVRRELTGIPGSPPDLRDPLAGCPFVPRCGFAVPACTAVDMTLEPWNGSHEARSYLPGSARLEQPAQWRPGERRVGRASRQRGRRAGRRARRRRVGRRRARPARAGGRRPRQGLQAGPRPGAARGQERVVRPVPGRGRRAGGGERFRQVHRGQAAGRAGAAHPRVGQAGGQAGRRRQQPPVPPVQAPGAVRLPGPVQLAEPHAHGRLPPDPPGEAAPARGQGRQARGHRPA